MLKFQANKVSVEYDENEILIISFAEVKEDGEYQHYFQIQYSKEYDEQDLALGMNTYYIERDSQTYGTYGGIKRILFNSQSIRVELNELGVKCLRLDTVIIELPLIQEKYSELKDALYEIFEKEYLIEEQ